MKTLLILFLLTISIFPKNKVQIGIERLITDKFSLIENKKIGIIANHSSILSNGDHIVDFLHKTNKVKIISVFGPEHGFRGEAPDGKKIENEIDKATGIPVISLYGKINKPTPEMLKDIEILVFDIQDVGARFYTYISTLNNCLEAAAENDIKFIVCDRPNPISGIPFDGFILKKELRSFVGIQPIPIQHGMTVGELAYMFNEEGWVANGKKADLEIIKVKNWKREMFFDETGINWIKPSPNLVNLDAAIVYPGLCLIEGTNISEGRGTYEPFLNIGAPFIKSDELIAELNKLDLKGVEFESIKFTPVKIPNMTSSPKLENQECNGIKIMIKNRKEIEVVKLGVAIIYLLNKLYPEQFQLRENSINRLSGDKRLFEMIKNKINLDEIFASWQDELSNFKKLREKYLLY